MNKLQITLLSLLALTTGCTNEMDETSSTGNQGVAIVQATIGESIISRAEMRSDDKISYSKFNSNDDEIGLFATKGLAADNMKLAYSDGSFKSTDLQWTGGNAENVYAYFPYSADKESINIWRGAKENFWKEGFNDMLIASNSSVPEGAIINLNFTHQFAMLIIKRGKGFDNVPAGTSTDVSITLNQSVGKTAGITAEKNFILNNTNGIKELSTNPGKYDGKDVYYVIIPVGKIDDKAVNVASITLCNNLGREMTVTPSITPAKNNKYVIEVKMLDNQAVASPIEIVRWDDEDMTIVQPAGIKDIEGFTKWASTYNTDISNDFTQEAKSDILKKYGTHDGSKWTFRLLEDIDLTNQDFNGITKFIDTFDGQGHVISGINIHEGDADDARSTGFVRTLSGTITSLILKDATIYGKSDIGGFAGKAESGAKVSKCQLTGASIIFGTSNVDAFIGNNAVGATIEKCTQAPTVIIKTGSSN